MERIHFRTLQNGEVSVLPFEDLFFGKRILFCSTESSRLRIMHHYYKHLSRCVRKYELQGIDKICVVDSCDDNWTLATISTWFPSLVPLVDNEKSFLNHIRKQLKKSQSIDFLSKNWIYQILIDNGEIEFFTEESTEDRFQHLKKNFSKIPFHKLKKYNDKKNMLLHRLPALLRQRDEMIFQSKSTIPSLYAKYIFYGTVWPNVKLEEHLKNNKKN